MRFTNFVCKPLFSAVVVFFSFGSLVSASASMEWQSLIPKPGLGAANAMYFTDSLKGYFGGSSLYETRDGGKTWVSKWPGSKWPEPQRISINFIGFSSEKNGWAAGDGGFLLRSLDSGANWSKVSANTSKKLLKVSFVSEHVGWLLGEEGNIWKTTDGGDSWELASSLKPNLNDIHFVGDKLGYGVENTGKSAQVYRTTNAGGTWTQLYSFYAAGSDVDRFEIMSVFFLDSTTGWLVSSETRYGRGRIFKSIDGGKSWATVVDLVSGHPFAKISFLGRLGLAFTSQSHELLRSFDSGSTWKEYDIPYATSNVIFLDSNTGFASNGTVYKTVDGGLTWNGILPSEPHQGVSAIRAPDKDHIWMVTDSIYRSSDGGESWQSTLKAQGTLKVIDKDTAWLSPSPLLKTNDGGKMWQPMANPFPSSADTGLFFFLNGNMGWAVEPGEPPHPLIKQTVDGGASWSTVGALPLTYPYPVKKVYFLDSLNGWVLGLVHSTYIWVDGVGTTVTMLHTETGGREWTYVPVKDGDDKIQFFSKDLGYTAGSSGGKITVYRDGGNKLESIPTPVPSIAAFQFVTPLQGWIISGYDNAVFYTQTGGAQWEGLGRCCSSLYMESYGTQGSFWVGGGDGALSMSPMEILSVPVGLRKIFAPPVVGKGKAGYDVLGRINRRLKSKRISQSLGRAVIPK